MPQVNTSEVSRIKHLCNLPRKSPVGQNPFDPRSRGFVKWQILASENRPQFGCKNT